MTRIRNKIVFATIALIILLITTLLILFNNLYKETHLNIIKREMNEKIRYVALCLEQSNAINTFVPGNSLDKAVKRLSGIIDLRITLIDFKGNVIADSEIGKTDEMDNHRYRPEIDYAIDGESGESIRYSNTLKIDMLYIAAKTEKFIIRLAKPLHEIKETLSKLRIIIFLAGTILTVIAVIIVVLFSNKITNPITETRNFAEEFSKGNYSKRILNYSDDEIGVLQKALNRMAGSIVDKMNSLINEQNKLAVTIDNISDGIAVIDHDKRVQIANRAFNRILDIKTETKNKIYYEVIRGSSLNSRIEKAIKNGQSANFQEEMITGKYCEVYLIPIQEQKAIQGILAVIRDITEKRLIDQLKTDLVGNISHELKTPIAIQKGYLETILDHLEDKEMIRDFIKKALSNVNRQNALINDMLKLNMLETMRSFPEEETNLRDVVSNCMEILSLKASDKHISLEADIDDLDLKIVINRFLSEEIFFNIIDNAINYTDSGGKVFVKSVRNKNHVKVEISDTGIGIPSESISRIFERFYRVDKSRSRATGGTGLGLSIVKHSVEILGWDIDVDSSGDGTTFSIKINA
ncbi:MAG: PAS domain-containing protein [Spirochaetes bacterium]|nr:PAS domain-containing protein [Spirochaetota bacterium]